MNKSKATRAFTTGNPLSKRPSPTNETTGTIPSGLKNLQHAHHTVNVLILVVDAKVVTMFQQPFGYLSHPLIIISAYYTLYKVIPTSIRTDGHIKWMMDNRGARIV
jgi:hypothetical protein